MEFKPNNSSDYAHNVWISSFGSAPIREVASCDNSADYEMDAAHVFELENGKFAVVIERGCSCYDYSDASIDVVDNKEEAMKIYESNGGT